MTDLSFKRTAFQQGGSIAVTIPPELLEYIQAKEGDTINLLAKNGKKGKYLAIWCEGK